MMKRALKYLFFAAISLYLGLPSAFADTQTQPEVTQELVLHQLQVPFGDPSHRDFLAMLNQAKKPKLTLLYGEGLLEKQAPGERNPTIHFLLDHLPLHTNPQLHRLLRQALRSEHAFAKQKAADIISGRPKTADLEPTNQE